MSESLYDVYGRNGEDTRWVITVVGCDLEYAAQFQARCERDRHMWDSTIVVRHGEKPALTTAAYPLTFSPYTPPNER